MTEHYPWHNPHWERVVRWQQRLPHAVLLEGPPGVGKRAFAERWSRALICATPTETGDACGQCRDCLWLSNDTHPDFKAVSVELEDTEDEDATPRRRNVEISVAQIRAVTASLHLSRHSARHRVVLIHPADAMNAQAANALLKALEEPGEDIVFLLVTHRYAALLPTIRSRCQRLTFGLPSPQLAKAWLSDQGVADPALALALAGGAPLAASDATRSASSRQVLSALSHPENLDYILLAERCASDYAQAVDWLHRWLFDILSMAIFGSIRYNIDFIDEIRELSRAIDAQSLGRFYRETTRARRMAHHPLNAQLALETLFMQYRQFTTQKKEVAHV